MLDVITMGSATVDVFVDLDPGSQKDGRMLCVERGNKALIEKLVTATGGGGTNVAVALSRLGYKTAYIGKIGMGANSKRVLNDLKTNKVKTHLVDHGRGRTGYSIILNAGSGDRSILSFKGSNNDIRWQDIPMRKVKARWLYATSMIGQSWIALEKVVAHCHKRGMGVCFNPSSYLTKKGQGFLKLVLRLTNILILNLAEAKLLVGESYGLKDLFVAIHKMGPLIVCITEGKKGAHISDGSNYYSLSADIKLKVVENTGAGDAFGAGFLAGLMARYDVVTAAKMGMTNAEAVLRFYGAKEGLLSWRALRQLAESRPCKISVRPL